MTELETPTRAAVIMAHPDDPDFSSAGTVARWTDAGAEVFYVVVTDGSKGTPDRSTIPHELIGTRKTEQRAAARLVGVADVVFLGEIDGEVVPDLALRRLLTRQIRQLRPDTVITHDPARFYYDTYINHPDHRAVGQATLDAIFPTARDHLNYPDHLTEGLEPHKVTTVLLSGAVAADTFLDITATFDRKLAALREHKSQIEDMEGLAERLRERHSALGHDHGFGMAEAFKRITLT